MASATIAHRNDLLTKAQEAVAAIDRMPIEATSLSLNATSAVADFLDTLPDGAIIAALERRLNVQPKKPA